MSLVSHLSPPLFISSVSEEAPGLVCLFVVDGCGVLNGVVGEAERVMR